MSCANRTYRPYPVDVATSRGPIIALNQLELEFEGVTPLSAEERVARWLAEQEDESEEVITAALFLEDGSSRADRAERWAEIRAIQAPYDRAHGWLVPGGSEAVWLYEESVRAYVHGLFLAALLCAHSACERVIAGCLLGYEEKLDKRWRRWGLGPLAAKALEFGLIDDDLRRGLDEVTELRKVSAHFKPPLEPNSVLVRTCRALAAGSELEDALESTLRSDAKTAIEITTWLLRGDQGFARARIW